MPPSAKPQDLRSLDTSREFFHPHESRPHLAFWRRTISPISSRRLNSCFIRKAMSVVDCQVSGCSQDEPGAGFLRCLLIDLNYTRDTTSGREGLDLLSDIVALDSNLPVIVMTAWGNVELAVEAMRRGARDFIQKPWENERLLAILRTQIELHRALQRAERLAAENRLLRVQDRPEFIAAAVSMQAVLETIARVGPSDANVLITGEHGSGKEVVAQTLMRFRRALRARWLR